MEKVHRTTTKKEFLREAIYIIDHLHLLWEFVPEVIKISRVMSDSCAKEKSLVSSSEKGKAKVSRGNKRPMKKKNKRTPINTSLTIVNSCDQLRI